MNWPQQQLKNGRSLNTQTNHRYKKYVRALKNAESFLAAAGTIDELPSYFMECLVFNVPAFRRPRRLVPGHAGRTVASSRIRGGRTEDGRAQLDEVAFHQRQEVVGAGREGPRPGNPAAPWIRKLTSDVRPTALVRVVVLTVGIAYADVLAISGISLDSTAKILVGWFPPRCCSSAHLGSLGVARLPTQQADAPTSYRWTVGSEPDSNRRKSHSGWQQPRAHSCPHRH